MKITIPGVPLAKARHRSFLLGKHIRTYDAQSKEKDSVRWLMVKALQDAFNSEDRGSVLDASNLAFAGPISVEFVFYMPFPKSKSVSLTNRFLWGLEIPDVKPDLDNMEKFGCDCANGILFQDDKQIVELKSKKLYSLIPRTEIIIVPKKKLELHETAELILKTLNPSDFKNLTELTYELCCFTSSFDENGALKADLMDQEDYRKKLSQTAMYVSLLAEKYASYLSKIKKDFPKFCEVYEKSTTCKAALQNQLRDGKVLC